MPVKGEWLRENIGIEASHPKPETLDSAPDTDQQFRRELIDFDSEGASGATFSPRHRWLPLDCPTSMVREEIGTAAPHYVVVRNVSASQIDPAGQTLAQQKRMARSIYQAYGLRSSIRSAIVCWAIVASL
jgi:hypothetical protein